MGDRKVVQINVGGSINGRLAWLAQLDPGASFERKDSMPHFAEVSKSLHHARPRHFNVKLQCGFLPKFQITWSLGRPIIETVHIGTCCCTFCTESSRHG